MKTRILSNLAILSMIFATNLLTACDDDDDDGGSSVYNAEATVLTTADGDKLLVTQCGSYSYEYDDEGNLNAISTDDYDFEVSTNPFKLTDSYDSRTTTITLTTNGNGYITKAVFYENCEGKSISITQETINFSYNSSSHLTKITYSGTEYYDESYYGEGTGSSTFSGTVTLTWSNDKIATISTSENEYDDDGDKYTREQTLSLSFAEDDDLDYENTTNQYVPTLFWKDNSYELQYIKDGVEPYLGQRNCLDFSVFAYIGLLGVGPTYIPESADLSIEYEEYDAEDDETETVSETFEFGFSYNFNDDGSVRYCKSSGSFSVSDYIYYDDYPE